MSDTDSYSPKKEMERFMAEAQEDLEIDQMIIADKLEHHPRMVNKWLRYYYDNEHRILTMKRAREDKFEQLKLELESGDDIRYKSIYK